AIDVEDEAIGTRGDGREAAETLLGRSAAAFGGGSLSGSRNEPYRARWTSCRARGGHAIGLSGRRGRTRDGAEIAGDAIQAGVFAAGKLAQGVAGDVEDFQGDFFGGFGEGVINLRAKRRILAIEAAVGAGVGGDGAPAHGGVGLIEDGRGDELVGLELA